MSGSDNGLAPHILHVLPQGASTGLIGAFGTKLRHTLVMADGAMPAGLQPSAYLRLASNFPPIEGLPTPGRMQKLARAMTPFDLVLTHGPEALDVAMAHTLFKDAMSLPALVHHEYEPDEKSVLKRKWYRRLALGKSAGVVVPGETLEAAALVDWQQPLGRVKRIAPGIDTKAFAKRPKKDGFRLIKRDGERWIGMHRECSSDAGLARVLEAFAPLGEDFHLVILGQTEEQSDIEAVVDRLEINHRVHHAGEVTDMPKVMGLFDIYVQPDSPVSFPVHIVEAMAAAVPVIAPGGGEIEELLSKENRNWLPNAGDADALASFLRDLSADATLRKAVGEANRARAVKEFDRDKTIATYRRLYSSAMKREF
ncbi:glycosyltransferase family 4 protein [Qipengyuania vesicularis]|uniref:glycosyltransferase family 4 protein n=1 Tax=Qipengyuania vesicularis TaxID=2867232 RepID=UPI001C87D882|nr:glycosyltransferase family 4 protein [Qipengyuania vesicularis]MBX7526331.1 glycosyltransferase family 4 protein [Qipengyuania vesicularis]